MELHTRYNECGKNVEIEFMRVAHKTHDCDGHVIMIKRMLIIEDDDGNDNSDGNNDGIADDEDDDGDG